MIKFEVKNRYSGAVQFTAEIDKKASDSKRSKMGAAVKWAISKGADLRGADLRGNAPIEGEAPRPTDQIQGLRRRAYRSDGYEFAIFRMGDDGLVIRAGCRTFTPDEFEMHIVKSYPDHPKATETRRIIAFLIEQSNAEAW